MDLEFMFRLRKALSEKGISRTELSQISGVAKGDITHYMNGDYVPKQDKCYLLAKALDVDPGWLMTGYEPASKKMDLQWFGEADDQPRTPEARLLARGIDSMHQAQREAIMNMMIGLYPNVFKKGPEDDDT